MLPIVWKFMKKPKKSFLLSDVYSLTPYTNFYVAVNKEIGKIL
jgi:hypothetical protein